LNILAYIVINLLLFSSWYIALYRKKECLLFADRLIGAFILGLTQIIATSMVLGVVFEKLFSDSLFILNLLISLCILVPLFMTGKYKGALIEIRDESTRFFRIILGDRALLCIFSLFVISLLWLIALGYLFPSYSWDALYYHLPIVGQILQSGAIQENPTPSFIQQYMNLFSKNINLFFLWNIIFLKHDLIVDLTQLFFTLAGTLSVYSMAVKIGVKEKYAIYSSLLFFFTPVLILQSTANYVDGAVSMLFLIALNFLVYDGLEVFPSTKGLARSLNESKIPVLLSGLAAGILLGSKPTGPLFIIIMSGAIVIQEIVIKRKSLSRMPEGNKYELRKGMQIYLVYFLIPVLLTGGYWYMRNWLFYGNPVYYMDISLFGTTLLKGLKSDWVEPAPQVIDNLNYLTSLFYVWLERVGYYMYDSRLSGFGSIWFILFIPSILFTLIHAVITKKYNLLFISSILLVTFFLHPRNWTTRYVVFIVGLGALSFSYAFDYFSRRESTLRIIALLCAGYAFITINSPCIMPGKIKEFLSLPVHERTLSRLKPFNIDLKVRDEYGYWMWIDNNLSRGDILAYAFESFELDTNRPFFTAPLWNREYSSKVVYLKSDTYKDWLQELENNSATYVLVKKGSIEDAWIEKERRLYYSLSWMGSVPERFKIVYDDEKYKIARFGQGGRLKDEG
jgi:hypothetical protein